MTTENERIIIQYRDLLETLGGDYATRRAIRAAYADSFADALEAADAKLRHIGEAIERARGLFEDSHAVDVTTKALIDILDGDDY